MQVLVDMARLILRPALQKQVYIRPERVLFFFLHALSVTHSLSLSLSLGKEQTIDVAIQPSVGGEFNIQLKVPSAIADVKSAIAAAKGHSVGQQRLLFESEEPLEDTQLLQPLFANKQRRLLYLVLVPVNDVSVLLELNSTKQLDGRRYNKLRKGMTIEQVSELNLGGVTIRDGRVVELDLSRSGITSECAARLRHHHTCDNI